MAITVRPLCVEDSHDVARIFFEAVQVGTNELYSDEQRSAWGGNTPDPDGWRLKLPGLIGYVAEEDGRPVGFMTIDATGLIDFAFVAPSAARKGVGRILYRAIEDRARSLGARTLTTHASWAARPFFERHGWTLEQNQTVMRRGVALSNCLMRKLL